MKLKRIFFGLVLGIFACSLSVAAPRKAEPPPRQTGADWLLMSPEQKVACIHSTLAFLRSKGIPIRRPDGYYGAALNQVVDQPGAEKARIANLVTTLIYRNEPQSRRMIDELRVKPDGKAAPVPKK